ncbi:uncharacterized protein BDV17DRAFT_275568 [Aspergillus undulatus]|uniref:uncharacterized protein n=1 Tax=Aspergillus undulatus TaxID=1810928 RepID=UPI003CCCBC65
MAWIKLGKRDISPSFKVQGRFSSNEPVVPPCAWSAESQQSRPVSAQYCYCILGL